MTLDTSGSVYHLLTSSAAKGLKYDLANSVSSHQSGVPHLFTLSFKLGSKPPININPVHVLFDAGTIKISSFVCLVGLGLGISGYIVYKIYKQVFPIRVNSLSSIINSNNNNNNSNNNNNNNSNNNNDANKKASKVDKIKVTASSSVSDSSRDDDGKLEINRKQHLQNTERHARRRKASLRTKRASPSTDSDVDHRLEAVPPNFRSGGEEVKNPSSRGIGSRYDFLDDHRGNRFVMTPVEPGDGCSRTGRELRCDSVLARRCMQSTPDCKVVDFEESNAESETRDSSRKDVGSDSDGTGVGLSQPSSEMFETAKDVILSGTLDEMEQLQSQLDLLYNDVDDLSCEMESLQKREDPKETVARRYTLGAEEALTAKKNETKESSRKKATRDRSRFLRRLDLRSSSLAKEDRSRSYDLLGSDRSEDGVVALVVNDESKFRGSFVSDVCSELERLSSDDGIVKLSDTSCDSASCERVLGDRSGSSPVGRRNETFVIEAEDLESGRAEGSPGGKVKKKKSKLDMTDDLYIDDDIISLSSDDPKRGNKKSLSFLADDMISPTTQFFIRPQSFNGFKERNSIYQTPDSRSLAANVPSPWSVENKDSKNYIDYLASRDDHLNLVNNNINLNLIGELLFLSSGNGPLSPRTSNFLATCMESPSGASANLDIKAIGKFMEKIGRAVVGFGSSAAPPKKGPGRALSTPVDGSSRSKAFLGTVNKLCESFPLWVVCNLEEPLEILEYAGKKFCANTESHIYQGYEHISQLIGARSVCSVRRDNFCSIRATLCQAILSDKLKTFSREFKDNYDKYLQAFEATDNNYLRSSCFSNRLPFNKGSELEVIRRCFDLLLDVITSQDEIHSKVHDPTQKEEQLKSLLDALFNGCPIIDLHIMEAMKMVMMVELIELHRAFSAKPIQSKPLAWSIFSGKSSRCPEQFFKNRMRVIGDTQSPNKVELSLLASCLRIKLEVLRPALFLGRSEDFVSHYPDEGADDFEKVTLVQEADDAFLLVLQ